MIAAHAVFRTAQKRGERGVGSAPSEIATVARMVSSGAIMSLAIRESLLGQLPDSLVGVELRRIGREALEVNLLGASAKLTDELASMGICAVPPH